MTTGYNYQRFTGWRLIALLTVFFAYTLWFATIGPFGELIRLEDYAYLQGRGFYSGDEAVAAIQSLSPEGRRLKYTELGFDLIYMVLQTWVFEAVIAYGLTAMGLMGSRWRWILLAPMGFLLFDFLEDSSLALVLATSSELAGTFAGVFTALKFAVFIPLVFISLGVGTAGFLSTSLRKRKADDSPN